MVMKSGQTDPTLAPLPMPATGVAGDTHGNNIVKACAHCGANITNKALYRDDDGKEFCSMSCLDGGGGSGDTTPVETEEYVP